MSQDTIGNELLGRFNELIVEGQERYTSYIRSHNDIRRCLVRIYLWWAESNTHLDVIEAIEKRYGMSVVKMNGNRLNFTNLIRIVFERTEAYDPEYQKLYQWGLAVSALHEEYIQNSKRYRNNAEGTLLKFFNDKGGINGLIKYEPANDDYTNNPLPLPAARSKQQSKTSSNKSSLAIQQQARNWVKTAAGTGSAISQAPVRADAEGFVALLARRNSDGTLAIIGSSNDANAISLISQSIASTNTNLLPYTLRLFVDVIRTQLYPFFALPPNVENRTAWFKSVLLDQSVLKTSALASFKKGTKPTALWSPKKLLIRGFQKDILLSCSKSGVSVVTRFVPHKLPIDAKHEVFLRVVERNQLERLLETGEAFILDTKATDKLQKGATDDKSAYKLPLTNVADGTVHTFRFYSTKPYAGTLTGFQAEFDDKAFKPLWSFKVEPHWFGKLREDMLDKWFSVFGSGTQIKRANNLVMELAVSASEFTLYFNIDDRGKAPHSIAVETKVDGAAACFLTKHRSKDLAPVFYNLADVLIDGVIEVKGNADAVVFEYTSDIGSFQIAVPSVVAKGKKLVLNSKAFSDYRYV